ncbi:MAG: hypothetical protein LH477_11110 [Nocardioides sp.]|nr:hypothetical protein [Nocardioides sp.]
MPDLETTRLSLHTVAELVLAGPQFEQSRTIKLRVSPGGFATVTTPQARVDGTSLVATGRTVPLDGRTVADVAAEAGLGPRPLEDVYSGGCGLSRKHPLTVKEPAAAEIAEAFRRGEEAMAALAPDAERVLWPEHLDLAISLDEVNYGVSPGDSTIPVPYAYVGPWTPSAATGPFWNAPFGAAHSLRELADLLGFFAEGKALTSAARR